VSKLIGLALPDTMSAVRYSHTVDDVEVVDVRTATQVPSGEKRPSVRSFGGAQTSVVDAARGSRNGATERRLDPRRGVGPAAPLPLELREALERRRAFENPPRRLGGVLKIIGWPAACTLAQAAHSM
jgi:hypothetical protein